MSSSTERGEIQDGIQDPGPSAGPSGTQSQAQSGVRVGLVLVSHSATLAEGLRALATQMAADVKIVAAGGTDDDGIGTSYERIEEAVQQLRSEDLEVLLLTDLGSATMTVQTLLEFYEDDPIIFVDAPLVEGAVAAAVAAQQKDGLEQVAAAARGVLATFGVDDPGAQGNAGNTGDAGNLNDAGVASNPAGTNAESTGSEGSDTYTVTATVADKAGLHARPAAVVAGLACDAEGTVTINATDAESAMMIMALGLACGETVTISGNVQDKAVIDGIAARINEGIDN